MGGSGWWLGGGGCQPRRGGEALSDIVERGTRERPQTELGGWLAREARREFSLTLKYPPFTTSILSYRQQLDVCSKIVIL